MPVHSCYNYMRVIAGTTRYILPVLSYVKFLILVRRWFVRRATDSGPFCRGAGTYYDGLRFHTTSVGSSLNSSSIIPAGTPLQVDGNPSDLVKWFF